jgi:hypothetical protein
MPWSKMLFNNQSTITVDSPGQQKPMFRGEHNGPGHFILVGLEIIVIKEVICKIGHVF